MSNGTQRMECFFFITNMVLGIVKCYREVMPFSIYRRFGNILFACIPGTTGVRNVKKFAYIHSIGSECSYCTYCLPNVNIWTPESHVLAVCALLSLE